MANKYITINNYFKCQWTNWSHQKTEWLIGLKKKNRTHLYAAYRILPLEIKTATDWKCKDGKRKQGNNTHIIQNRLKNKAVSKDREGHYIMLKTSTQEEDVTLINTFAPNTGASWWLSWWRIFLRCNLGSIPGLGRSPGKFLEICKVNIIDIKGEADNYTMLVGEFNSPLTSV